MRRFAALILAALALTVVGSAYALTRSPGDGTLAIKSGDGAVSLNVRGAIIGLVAQGKIEVEGPKDGDCDALSVWGAERERIGLKRDDDAGLVTICVFGGKDVRLRLVGGQYNVRLVGKDISLSAVGRGIVSLKGAGGTTDGTFSFNGGEFTSLPDDSKRFVLASPLPASPGTTP